MAIFMEVAIEFCFIIAIVPWTFSSPIFENDNDVRSFLVDDPRYLNYHDLTTFLQTLEKTFPDLSRLYNVGKSVRQRDLWVLQISADVQRREERPILTPMFKYVANVHGNEVLGRQLLVYLAQHLLINYGRDDRVTWIVNNTDIHLMPSMNPDGYEISEEGNCVSKNNSVDRKNANGVDLNRDFPDRFDVVTTTDMHVERQPETVALMKWIGANPFVLSASLHGGALLVRYPFDNVQTADSCCVESPTPDDDLFKTLALTYADLHPLMNKGNACASDNFENGIINGAFWYGIKGGMQDFNYVHSNCFDLTIELSCCKFPLSRELSDEWNQNKNSLLAFMEATHWGIKGLVTNKRGNPVKKANFLVKGITRNVTTSEKGEYWRLLLPGKYTVGVVALGYHPSKEILIEVVAGHTTIQHFILDEIK